MGGTGGGSGGRAGAVDAGVGVEGGVDDAPRFPRLDQCAHFHYEYVELPPLQVMEGDGNGGRKDGPCWRVLALLGDGH